jgi:hypothetical protein
MTSEHADEQIKGRRMMLRLGLTMSFVATAHLAAARLAAQGTDVPAQGAGRVAAQLTIGTLAEPVGFIGGGLAFRAVARRFHMAEDDASRVADIGATIGTALAASSAAALIGSRGPGRGSYPAALGGALAGTGVSGILILINRKTDVEPGKPCHLTCILTTSAIATLPSIGATVAYNASRGRR